jgi:hypothetical protein
MSRADEDLNEAKLEEVDRMIEELRRRRGELEAKTLRKESEPAGNSEEVLAGILESLGWRARPKKDGEWAFLRDRDGNLREELQPVADFVTSLGKQKEVHVRGFRYTLQEDKYLYRFALLL